MAKPTDDITWSSDADYPAGPQSYAGTPTCTEPDAGRKATGWEPAIKPPAQGMNWWQRGIARWTQWFAALFADSGHLLELDPFLAAINAVTIKRSRLPDLWDQNGWTQGSNLTTYGNDSIQCSVLAANFAAIEADIPIGHVLKNITFTAKASAGGQGIGLILFTNQTAAVPSVIWNQGAMSIGAITVASADFTIHFDVSTHQNMTCQTTFDGAGVTPNIYTYTRAAGSFVTDGFKVGHMVDSSGWGIAEHNFTRYYVVTVAALTMTVQQSTPVARVSAAAETLVATIACTPVVSPVGGGGFGFILEATGSAGVAIANIAYEHAPPAITY